MAHSSRRAFAVILPPPSRALASVFDLAPRIPLRSIRCYTLPPAQQAEKHLSPLQISKILLSWCLSCVLAGILISTLLKAEIGDRVAAVVNNRVITLSDLQWSFVNSQKPAPADPEERKKSMDAALNRLIEQELVAQEVEKEPLFTLREEDVDSELKKLERRYGSRAQLEAELKRSGLPLEQLRINIRRQLSLLKFIDVRFRPFVIVLPDEIATYYRETLVPELKKEGIEHPPSLEKMSAQIEEILIEQKVDQELEKWLSNVRKRAKIVILLFREQSPNVPSPELLKDDQKKRGRQ